MTPSRLALFTLALTLGSALTGAAQDRFANVEMKLTHVAGSVHQLEGAGGNIGVSVGEDGILLVDDQFAPLAPKIRAALAGLSKGELEYVLNTHWHGDHVGGNEIFGTEATIVAHENVRARLATDQALARGEFKARPAEALPVITFDSKLSLHFNGEEIRALHLPHGHTDGDSAIWFTKSRVLHAGDHLFVDRFPFVDLDSGGTVDGYAENLATLIELIPDDAKVIAGHGALSSKKELRALRDMILETRAKVKAQLAKGLGLDAIVEAGLGEKWKAWTWGFIPEERWIRTLHRDLTAR